MDDFQNIELDRPGRGKSLEQIKKHTVDEQFENRPIERSVFLLTKGDDIQKLSVIQTLPQLLQTEPHATYSRIIPKILQELPNSSCEFHVITSKVFRSLMERQVPVNLLHAVLQGIESRDPIVANAWMETLLSIIGVLTDGQLKHEIIPLANSKSLLSQTVTSRIASCRILGKLAVHRVMDPMAVKRDVLPLAQSLCQDCHPDVRTAMCMQLPHVAQGLGSSLVKGNLLTSLVELASDDNMFVRSASVTATVQMFPYITVEIKKGTILPLVRQLNEKCLKSDDITSSTIAKEMGRLVDGLQTVVASSEGIWFLECYKTLARRGLATNIGEFRSSDTSLDVMCRQNCAANLPAMALFTTSTIPGQIEVLYSVFRDLAADPCYIVRRTVAGCIHEVVRIFGAQSKMLKPDFVRLLRDDSEDVLEMLVPQMGTTLECFCTYGLLSRETSSISTVEIGRAMLKCQYALTGGLNWRLLTHFVHELEHLPNCMPPDFIHQHFTPVILTCAVQGRAKPVRSQAARTLLVFLRYNSKELQRRWLRDNLVSQLCYSKDCYTRHIFIRLCINAIDIFSKKYFKDHFYDILLDLADDPVANIRLCVASLFTVLKQMLVLPADQLQNERLCEVFEKYSRETDKDVKDVFLRKMQELKKPQVGKEEYDKEERRRQEEEDRIITFGKTNNVRVPENKKVPVSKQQMVRPSSKHLSSHDFTVSKSNSNSQHRSSSVPPKAAVSPNQSSDMRFLEQHFYIDAGVNLPTSDSVCKLTNNSFIEDGAPLPPYEITQDGIDALNITDDDKVNLRKLPLSKSNDKNKRYSSILSITCMEKTNTRKVLHRRSLNILPKETSKIPISCVKKLENNVTEIKFEQQVNNDENSLMIENNDSTKSTSKTVSHLPVPTRRSVSEARKKY